METKRRPLNVSWSMPRTDWELPAIILAVGVASYGCSMSNSIDQKTEAYRQCAIAKEVTPTCKIILEAK